MKVLMKRCLIEANSERRLCFPKALIALGKSHSFKNGAVAETSLLVIEITAVLSS